MQRAFACLLSIHVRFYTKAEAKMVVQADGNALSLSLMLWLSTWLLQGQALNEHAGMGIGMIHKAADTTKW